MNIFDKGFGKSNQDDSKSLDGPSSFIEALRKEFPFLDEHIEGMYLCSKDGKAVCTFGITPNMVQGIFGEGGRKIRSLCRHCMEKGPDIKRTGSVYE